jgi:hypothetical protein
LRQRATLPLNKQLISDRIVNDKMTLKTLSKQIQNELLMIDKLTNGLLQQPSVSVKESIMRKIKQSEEFILKATNRKEEIDKRIKSIQADSNIPSNLIKLIDKDLILLNVKSIRVALSELSIEL